MPTTTETKLQLRAQGEADRADEQGNWFGTEVFEGDGRFYVVIHTSRYEGIKRTSHYATPPVPLTATDLDAARIEARDQAVAYIKSVKGVPA